MTGEPKSKRNTKPRASTLPAKVPGDFAAKACNHVAKDIRDRLANWPEGDDTSGYLRYVFAYNVLVEVAAGRDPGKLIDRRKSANSASARAIKAVHTAMIDGSCSSMNQAYAAAAERVGDDVRSVRRYWSAYQAEMGVQAIPSWAPSSKSNPPGHTGHPAQSLVDWLNARRSRKRKPD